MNWFEPYFPEIIARTVWFSEIWTALALMVLGACLCVALTKKVTLRARAVWGGTFVFIEMALPETPLQFLAGQLGVLQTEAFVIIGLGVAGIMAAIRAAIRPQLARVTTAAAALMISALAFSYHLILINGYDQYARTVEAQELAQMVQMPNEELSQICGLPSMACGTGLRSDNAAFARNLRDWTQAARRAGHDRTLLVGSFGVLGPDETHVWAARMDGNDIQWIRRSYADKTKALQAVFFAFSAAAAAFWMTGALLVEYLHHRAWRRRAKRRSAS
jgi:hypothetical protein